jgi:hypothetical protein
MKCKFSAIFGLIILFFALYQRSQAQTGSPIEGGEKFNFSLNGVNFITNTIGIDTVKTTHSDSGFYLNRIVTGCDIGEATNKLSNQPDFLKTQMICEADSIYNFRILGTCFINITESVNEKTWNGQSIKK